MKKFLKIAAISVIVILFLFFVTAYLLLSHGVKAAVVAIGPQVTGTTVELSSVSLSPFSGNGSLSGFVVGNPEGFKGAQAMRVKSTHIALKISSVLSIPLSSSCFTSTARN